MNAPFPTMRTWVVLFRELSSSEIELSLPGWLSPEELRILCEDMGREWSGIVLFSEELDDEEVCDRVRTGAGLVSHPKAVQLIVNGAHVRQGGPIGIA